MAIKILRAPILAALLPILAILVVPGPVLAQFPCIQTPCGTDDTGLHYVCWCEGPSVLNCSDFDESWSGGILRCFRDAQWYFSFGGSRENWAPTNIHVSQPALGNNFTVHNVRADDDPSWSSAFGGQYNLRLGAFFDESKTLGVELNFDHTKYTSIIGQTAPITGSIAGKPANGIYPLTSQFFSYDLHNGANHLMVDLVKRVPLFGELDTPLSVAAIGKVGVGAMLPHPENTIMGQTVDVGGKTINNLVGVHQGWWQLDGWTTGVEAGFRVTLTSHVYLEITDKVAYAQLCDVSVYQGSASHNLWMNEIILSLGVTWGGGH